MSDQRHMTEDEFPDESPGDKQFGKAAAEKEETLDAAREKGEEDTLTSEPETTRPRAGGKAEPAGE